MSEVKTSRPFQQRFLDGFDRSQLREEVQKVKPKRLSGLRKKYASWALGASLAIGGLGIPMKMSSALDPQAAGANQKPGSAKGEETKPLTQDIARDLTTAKQIADQVAGGVQAATGDVGKIAQAPMQSVTEAPKAVVQAASAVASDAKAAFFQKEVPFGSIIYSEAQKNDLPPELVAAVVHTESKFVPTARSHAGAQGLMQLVPKTGRWMGATNLMNPAQNISAGTKYLRYLSDRFNGDQQKVIAAYNAGEGNVRKFNGVPPFKETRNYVARVKNFQRDLSTRMDGGVTQIADAGQ